MPVVGFAVRMAVLEALAARGTAPGGDSAGNGGGRDGDASVLRRQMIPVAVPAAVLGPREAARMGKKRRRREKDDAEASYHRPPEVHLS